jgi:hypothetical protein
MRITFGVFIILHGLVHLLYFGQSSRRFELQPGMIWPDGAWLISKFLSTEGTRALASVLLLLVCGGFVAGSAGFFMRTGWWRPLLAGSAVLSGLATLLFWDGSFQKLHDQGFIGLLISITILVVLLIMKWS